MKKVYSLLTALLVSMMLIPWQLNAQILLSENFDTLESGVPTGWVAEGTYSNSWQSTKGAYTSGWENSYGVYFNCYSASTGLTAILKTPVIDLSSSTKDMILSFNLYDADEDDIKVYLSKDGGATYEGTLLLECPKVSGWQTIEIPLAAYKAEQKVSIVWHGTSSYGYSRPTLDNVMIAPAPSCAVAENLFVTEQEQTGALLNWKLATGKGAAAETFAVEVYANGAETPFFSETLVVGDDIDSAAGVYSYFVEELNPGSAYYFTVKGICSADDEAVVAKSDIFYTACNPYVLPLALDTVTDTDLMPCWTMVNADYNNNTVYLNTNTTIFATPVLNHAANDIEVTLRYAGTSKGTGFYYGIASDASCADFDTLGYVTHNSSYGESKISVNTAGTKFGDATGKVFAIRPDTYMFIYGINVHQKPCCPSVEQVQAVAIDSASIEVSWLGSAASYNITLVDTVKNETINRTATTNPAVLGDLTPQTTYLVLVQANCGDCQSAWSDSIYVSTLCGVGEATFTESFEYEELGSVLPECWVQSKKDAWIVNHNISYYDTPNNAANGYSAIYMYYYGVESGKTATFSPQPFNVATPGQYDVKFAMYRYSKQYSSYEGDGTLTVWANNRPDTVGAVKVCEIDRYFEYAPAEKAAGWYYYDFNIPTVTGTVYLVFEGKSNAMNNLYLDDISVYASPSCRKVRNITLGEPTTTTVPVQWEAAEGTSQWVINYQVLAGETVVVSDSVLTSNNPFVVEGLENSSAYKIKGTVTTYCSDADRGEEISFEYDFQTACEAFTAFPYFEGFEGSFPPICWDMKNTAGNSAFVWQQNSSSQYVKEGQYAAYWSYKSAGSKAVLVTPEFTFPEDEEYRIELYAFRGTSGSSYTGEGFGIYLSETKEVTEDATLLAFIPRLTSESNEDGVFAVGTVDAQGLYQYKFDFNTSDYTGKYIIFEAVTNNGYYQSLDNLWIGPKPAIDVIAQFSVDSVVIDAARIKIPDETVALFDIIYGPKGFNVESEGTVVESIEGREYSLEGINPDTEYDVYVRARNAEGKVSAWSRNPVSFHTLCAAIAIDADNWYVEDFESYENYATALGCLVQSYGGSYNYRIATSMEYYDGSSSSYVTKYPSQGSNMAYLGSANNSWLFRAVELKAGQNYSIGVDALETSTYYEAKLMFGIASTPDKSSVETFLSGYVLPDCSDWERVTGYFTVPADGVYYVGVGIAYGASTVGIDSLVIRTESVIPPTVNVTELTDSKVSFELTSNASYWEMYYSTSKFDADTIPAESVILVENLTYAIENLQSNTTYYYAFRSYDEEDNASSWTAVGSFHTECGAIALPINQGFESSNIECWTMSGDGEVGLRAYNKQEGSYSWNVSGNKKLISPRVEGDLSNCIGSIWAGGQYEGERYTPIFAIGVMTNPQDAATYKAIDTVVVDYIVADGQLREYTFSLESLKEDAEYKDAKYFVFEHVQGYSFIDALTVDLAPTCPKPTEFVATAVAANTVTLDWVAGGSEASWSVLVKQGVDTVQTLVASEHPFTVAGLTGNTTYSFELRAICEAGVDSSRVVELKNITTACDVYALPYEDDLNGIPACWTIEDNNGNDYWSWSSYSGLTTLSSSMADSYDPDTARLFSSEFNFDKAYVMNIEMYTYYEEGTFNVLFDNGTTRDTIVAGYQHHDAWETCTYDMSEYVGQTGRIVFEGWGPQLTSGYSAYWYIRNISIVEPPVQYVVAGTSALTGFEWNNSENVMALDAETGLYSLTFSNVPAGEHQFKVSEFANWNAAYGYANLAADNTTAVYDLGTNVAFTLAEAADVTIEFNAEAKTIKVTTTGNFVEPVDLLDIYVAGSAGLCNGENWNPGAAVNKLVYDEATGEYVKVFSNVAAGTYEFKVASPGWAAEYTDVDAECSNEGWEGGNGSNIKFTLAETADVTIKLTVDQKVCLTTTLGEFGEVEITSYTLVGSAAIFGTEWNTLDENNNMVQNAETGVWTKVYENVSLEATTYNYKVVGNHAYEIFQYPAQNAELVIAEAGNYTVTFTLVVGEEISLTANAVKEVVTVAAPVFTPAPGDYLDKESMSVTLNCSTPDALIYWTYGEDASVNQYSFAYENPIPVDAKNNVISAVAILMDDNLKVVAKSEVVYATYNLKAEEVKPIEIRFNPAPGEYEGEVTVSIEYINAEGAVMNVYSIDGTDPMREYKEPIKLTETTTVKARVLLSMSPFTFSETVEATYTIKPKEEPIVVSAPVFTPAPGDYLDQETMNVTLYCSTPDALIYWTYGEDASVNQYSFAYENPIPVDAKNNVISAVAILMDDDLKVVAKSEVVYATYNLKEEEVKPIEIHFSPEPGEYTDDVTVVIDYINAEGGVMNVYSIDGTDPMREYKDPITLTETTTVKARVLLSMSPFTFSETVEATYIINKTGVGMDEVQLSAVVYAKDGFVYVATQQGAMVEVFTVQGQCIYSAEAATDLVAVDALNADVVLVRVNGETVKVAIK